ncbi:14107_t:CDS:2 [Ambispora leptoticha]|uniref:14107_t:CDS:1 n=1 Tax=Ambispora leptoticha TaxID=144679 RepID=A0A9N9FQM7_9GLOM|nr:14107_t:CDS:2 [Ambispora leptoticha]
MIRIDTFKHRKLISVFHGVRLLTIALVVLSYSTYVIFLVYQVWTDRPIIQLSNELMDKLEVPDIEMCGYGSDIQITRCVFTYTDWTSDTLVNCSKKGFPYVYAGPRTIENNYCYLFTGNKTLWFISAESNSKESKVEKKLLQLGFYFKILNLTSVEALVLSVPTVAMQILDPDDNILWKKTTKTKIAKGLNEELRLQGNNFDGIANYSTNVRFVKTTYCEIPDDDLSSRIGMSSGQAYVNTSTLITTAQYFPLHPNPNFTETTDSGYIELKPGSFINRVSAEKRLRTLIGTLGVAGGAFSVICTIYFLLFGDRKFRPFGIMHRVTQSEITDFVTLDNVPLITPFTDEKSLEQGRIELCENRIQNLETLLSNYFFDVTALTYIRERYLRRSNVESAVHDLRTVTSYATNEHNEHDNSNKQDV